jgi:hypothetical protein
MNLPQITEAYTCRECSAVLFPGNAGDLADQKRATLKGKNITKGKKQQLEITGTV